MLVDIQEQTLLALLVVGNLFEELLLRLLNEVDRVHRVRRQLS